MSLIEAVTQYVEQNIHTFHDKRLETVKTKRLDVVLKRKNPYLFKAKDTQTAAQLVQGIMDAFISSQEETLFGDFLEGVAIFVCEQVYNGRKPTTDELTGIDLIFERDDTIYIVEIKSGPNWGNSSQISKMAINFRDAITHLQTVYPQRTIVPVNGCMYGKTGNPDQIGKIKGERGVIAEVPYQKLCGQDFWMLISDDPRLYLDIIEPLGHQSEQRNELFDKEYRKLLNRFTKTFLDTYCHPDGSIHWEALTRFVSEHEQEK